MAKKTGTVDTWKTKKWYKIILPENFNSKEIADTVSSSEENLLGRQVGISLRDVTGHIKQQHIRISLEVTEIKGDKAITELVGFELHRDYLKRMIRKRMTIVEVISDVTCKDGKKLRVKTFVFTRRRVDTSQKEILRKIVSEMIPNVARSTDSQRFIQDAMFGKISSSIYKKTKTIVPIRRVEISKVKTVKEKKESSPKKE